MTGSGGCLLSPGLRLESVGVNRPCDGLEGRGGGVLRLEKGTDCGLTAVELWLSRAYIA